MITSYFLTTLIKQCYFKDKLNINHSYGLRSVQGMSEDTIPQEVSILKNNQMTGVKYLKGDCKLSCE